MNAGQQLYPVIKDIVDGRVYQRKRPETAKDKRTPYVVYNRATGTPETSQYGYTGHDWTRTQIDVYHDDYDELDNVVNQIKIAITQNIRPCDIGTSQDLDDAESELYRQSFDVEFFTEIPTPTP